MKKILFGLLFLFISGMPAFAQSTAQPVQLGSLSTSCSGSISPCFVPFSASNPLAVSGSTSTFSRTTVANTNYIVLSTDYLISYTSITAARAVTISCTVGSSTNPQFFIVKDESGSAGAGNSITLTPASGTIDGAANKAITTAYGVIRYYANGTNCFTW